MKIELSNEQISLVLNALGALAENAEYENKATVCGDIHEANDETINSVEALVKYIEGYKEVAPEVAVRVKGGLVQSVYANADVNVEVYDLDVSDFPDEGEEDKAAEEEAELEKLVASPGWRAVW